MELAPYTGARKSHNTIQLLRNALGGSAIGLALLLDGKTVGMMIYVPRFGCSLQGKKAIRTFIWYVSAAPPEFYWRNHQPEPRGAMLAMMDAAIQHGVYHANSDGLLLRSDPRGGARLRNFYEQRCRMDALHAVGHSVSLLRRFHTDQYFLLNRNKAWEFSREFDYLRESPAVL